MKNQKYLLIGSIVLFVALALGGLFIFLRDRGYLASDGNPTNNTGSNGEVAYIDEFTIQKPNLVARGANLGQVEIWFTATPNGTEAKLGDAQKTGTADGRETWTFQIPPNLKAHEIFARGFNSEGMPVARISLPEVGAQLEAALR
jgi:hypothetical protein